MQKKVEIISKSSTPSVVDLPPVFRTPVRSDLISFVHKNVALNKRQPYAVSPNAGKNYSAEGWGTGRAVARVPRIKGSGTRRAGQGAFANFCRGGHMAHPTSVMRRWQRKTPLSIRRLVTAMGISASALAPIVESRGHRISGLKSIPLVIDNEMLQGIEKTKDAVRFLNELGLSEEMDKTKEVFIKSGKGKMRNRRYKVKKGPLIVYDGEICAKAFRNVQGVDMCQVDSLSVLELCPGGQPGRLVIWMKDAFLKLHDLFGDFENEANLKPGFLLTGGIASNDDVEKIFYSCEVQAFIDEPCLVDKPKLVKNVQEIEKLNPYLSLID
ncbi:Ribosomal protein RPL1/RPL2/RL4L4 [Trachipleistophora hominis]|uniref:Ribosomal protein RPL1/RPL2/RL4L4 n=1 Tax=Trachipleistophora hominis TaxID=72359 RepID=L7JSK8_TRAHO|nr:Ribosomal protein RPL1/RPL2/RL4L4 [Trachipleistophora hominis]